MKLECNKCGEEFNAPRVVGYCEACRESYRAASKVRRQKQWDTQERVNVIHITGRWGDPSESPHSAFDPIANCNVCGMCGGELQGGYGFAGGFGLGAYMFCEECYTVQDFVEDTE